MHGPEEYAPVLQEPSESGAGVVVRQRSRPLELAQYCGCPFTCQGAYVLHDLPKGVRPAASPEDPKRWRPTDAQLRSLPATGSVTEHSSLVLRLASWCAGCLARRPLTWRVQRGGDAGSLVLRRPMRVGGFCCGSTCAQRTTVYDEEAGRLVGQVRESFDPYCARLFHFCCLCTSYHEILVPVAESARGGGDLEDQDAPGTQSMSGDDTFRDPSGSLLADPGLPPMRRTHTVVVNLCCFGPHNNCCAATPCRNDAVFDVRRGDPEGGPVASTIQRTYAAGGVIPNNAFFRCLNCSSNYVVGFPGGGDAAAGERDMFTAAALHIDHAAYEKCGGARPCGGGPPPNL